MASTNGTNGANGTNGTHNTAHRRDPRDLTIAIVGAGMGGLGCAIGLAKKGFRHISVYETASNLGFVGAGIQMAPNLVRILTRWDCWAQIEGDSTDVLVASIRDGPSDNELTRVDMSPIRSKYGFPHCTNHRASLAGGLFAACQKEDAITFHFGHQLVSVDSFSPKAVFTVADRRNKDESDSQHPTRQVTADILIGADGVKSVTRNTLLDKIGATERAEPTGQAAYRIMLPRDKMAHDPEMLALLDSNQVTRWIGERRHWIAYPIYNRQIYNMSSTQPDLHLNAPNMDATYTTKGSKAKMMDVFEDFCPLVKKLLDLVPEGEVCEWRLHVHKPLPTWVHGNVALLGDACHPTLPHLNQGAAMAIEDGAVMAEVLARLPLQGDEGDTEVINKSLNVYELLRKERTSALVDLAAFSGRTLHLGEGAAKEERDKQFAEAKKNGSGDVPDKWASSETQKMIYSHDCMKIAGEHFKALYAKQ